MVVGFTTTYAIRDYHHWCCGFKSRSRWGAQHFVIKFISDLWQVSGFLRVLQFSPPMKLMPWFYWNIVESGVKHHQTNQSEHFIKKILYSDWTIFECECKNCTWQFNDHKNRETYRPTSRLILLDLWLLHILSLHLPSHPKHTSFKLLWVKSRLHLWQPNSCSSFDLYSRTAVPGPRYLNTPGDTSLGSARCNCSCLACNS
jgi:hypothetical protein